jgi:Carboxymuconolactone decarboxylase family
MSRTKIAAISERTTATLRKPTQHEVDGSRARGMLWVLEGRRPIEASEAARHRSPMARLDVLKPSQVADPEVRAMLEASGDEMYGVYGHCPELFKAFLEFYRPAKYAGHLPFELKELVRLRVAALNECAR